MAFDLSTAKPVQEGFNLETAKPQQAAQVVDQFSTQEGKTFSIPPLREKGLPLAPGQPREDIQQPLSTPFPEERGETRAAQELPELGAGGLLGGQDAAKIALLSCPGTFPTNSPGKSSTNCSKAPTLLLSSTRIKSSHAPGST